jgi:hypothetical protein
MTSNDGTHIHKPASELFREVSAAEVHLKAAAPSSSSDVNQKQRKDPPPPVAAKAVHYPPGYPSSKQKEQCNMKEEKHKNCHPMHCHHMQPMQSATTTPNTADHQQQNQQQKHSK